MSEKEHYTYATSGRLWARGWTKYEARTMGWIMGIFIGSIVLGFAVSLFLGLWQGLAIGWSVLIFLAVAIVSLLIGVAIARATVPLIWQGQLMKALEKPHGSE